MMKYASRSVTLKHLEWKSEYFFLFFYTQKIVYVCHSKFHYHGDSNSCVTVITPILTHSTNPQTIHHLIQINQIFNDGNLEFVNVQSILRNLLYISWNDKTVRVSRLLKLFGMWLSLIKTACISSVYGLFVV